MLDPNGKKILEEQKGTFYLAVSESGYISKRSSESSLGGTTIKYSIVDKTGKELKPEHVGEISGGITNKTFYLVDIN